MTKKNYLNDFNTVQKRVEFVLTMPADLESHQLENARNRLPCL